MYACILNILALIFLLRAFALELCSLPTAGPSSLERINLLIYLGICSTPKISKQTVYFGLTNKAIQSVPVFSYSSKFITYAPFIILFGKLFLEYTPLNLGSFLQYSLISIFVNG